MTLASTISAERLGDFHSVLAPLITGELRTDLMSRALYSTDASMYQMQPLGVLLPGHPDDVQAALEIAQQFLIPVLPRGGGSSLAGQTVGDALVIDFSPYINNILELNQEEGWVRVQPGLVLDKLNRFLNVEAPSLMLGPDPASGNRATLGGMMANNATGTHSILYGNMIRHVRSATALLDDGTSVHFDTVDAAGWASRMKEAGRSGALYQALQTLMEEKGEIIANDTPKHWRRNSGYRLEALLDENQRNLAQVLCGSEGTLALVTEMTVNLVPRPAMTALGIVHFESRRKALEAVTTILETNPSAVELFDGVAIDQGRDAPGFAHRMTFVEGRPGAVLITEYYGDSEAELNHHLDALTRALEQARQGYTIVEVFDPRQIKDVWTVRQETLGLIMGVKGDFKPQPFIEDAAVPVEHLAEYIDGLVHLLEETDTHAAMYAHASGGCLHVRPFINTKDAAEVEKMVDIARGSMELVAQYGGAVSSEHGDGIVRGWLNEALLGKPLYNTYRELKNVFDPKGLLNPGKIVDVPNMTDHLRMGPTYHTIPLLVEQDFSEDHGFDRAIELCNGNGACRKLDQGVMCPSFMVTRDEEQSTRGRANALRLALSGALPPDSLTSKRMYEVMDLCIQCKGCKTECPSKVDMAKIKTEWLSNYWVANGMPFRTKLFANMPGITRWMAGPLAGPVNWINRRKSVRWLMDRTLGITAYRPLPPFVNESFTKGHQKQKWSSDGPPVVLFVDTFNNFNHKEVGHAAALFLHRIGYNVILVPEEVCCGRTFISKGLIEKAQMQALRTVESLHPFAEKGYPIVGLEPSCILTLTDEYRTLLPGDLWMTKVADLAMTFESFIAREADEGRLDHVKWKETESQVLLHGHCHQKALTGTGPAERCLSLPPNYTVETIESSCCGMAGSFGYEKEHLITSLAMAELRLAPTIRAAEADTVIAAAGTSCRAQIKDTTDREARHPAEILLEALA